MSNNYSNTFMRSQEKSKQENWMYLFSSPIMNKWGKDWRVYSLPPPRRWVIVWHYADTYLHHRSPICRKQERKKKQKTHKTGKKEKAKKHMRRMKHLTNNCDITNNNTTCQCIVFKIDHVCVEQEDTYDVGWYLGAVGCVHYRIIHSWTSSAMSSPMINKIVQFDQIFQSFLEVVVVTGEHLGTGGQHLDNWHLVPWQIKLTTEKELLLRSWFFIICGRLSFFTNYPSRQADDQAVLG